MPRTILDVHVLQTVPPSNLNRDDTGSPKTAYYGGVRRARVSSQAWKRVTRTAFKDLLDVGQLGVRTKKVVDVVAARIAAIDPSVPDPTVLATAVLKEAGIKLEKPTRGKDAEAQNEQPGYLLFLSRRQIDQLARLAVSTGAGGSIAKKDAKAAADSGHSIDVALFGRMVADAPDLNVDAAAQVAHAISVHAVDNEFDYFTAVDDKAPEDNAGAGMIGTVEFNSSTLYRYATVDVDELRTHLTGTQGEQDATASAVEAFLRAFVTSMPTGKQNTFANRTLPDAVLVHLRDRQSVNLVGAFEDAVTASETETRLAVASRRLAEYSEEVDAAFGGAPIATWVVRVGSSTVALAELGDAVSMDELISAVGARVVERAGVLA